MWRLANIVCVKPDYVEFIWPEVSHFIVDAFDANPSDDTFEEVERKIFNGNALLWVIAEGMNLHGAVVTEIFKLDDKKICCIVAVGGHGDWKKLIKSVEDYAKKENCTSVRISGRRGWMRVFKHEYDELWTTLEKRL